MKKEDIAKQRRICPDCNHDEKYHLNTTACYYPIGKHPDSELFEGATIRCLCERLYGFVVVQDEVESK